MKTIENLLQSDILQALGWTLIHAIWQVAAISLVLVLVLALLRGRSPRVRYNAALTALISVTGLSVLTYIVSYRFLAAQGLAVASAGSFQTAFDIQAGTAGYFDNLVAGLYKGLPLILLFWTVGVLLLSLRFAGNLMVLHRLKKKAFPVPVHWVRRLEDLARKRGIRRMVRLAESALISAPVMIGHFKPLILVPTGLLAAIPADQVEAILAHELAHIRRSDFLVNLLQSLLEIVYFFHPGIWWISQVLRRERELCCDDVATREGCDPLTLAFALSEMGEWAAAKNSGNLALAFAGNADTPLLGRVKRLLGHQAAPSWHLFPAGTLATALLVVFLLSGSDRAFSSSQADSEKPTLASTESGLRTQAAIQGAPEGHLVEIQSVHPMASSSQGVADTIPRGRDSVLSGNGPIPPTPPTMPDLPPTPEAPSLEPLPAIPPPPMPDSAAWSHYMGTRVDLTEIIADMTGNAGFNSKFDKKQMEELEAAAAEFEKKMEKWGEAYGKSMEAWAKANEPKLKEFEHKMKQWEKELEPKIKAYQLRMEAYQEGLEKYNRELNLPD